MSSYDTTNKSTEAATVAELARRCAEVHTFSVGDVQAFRNPGTGEISLFDQFRVKPHRFNEFCLPVADAPSFLKAVEHYAGTPRVVHFSVSSLTVRCILNHSRGTEPDWHDSKVEWKLEHDRFLKLWLDKENKWLSQTDLMEFLEERLEDVVQNPKPTKNALTGPSQSELMSVISDLRLTSEATFTSRKDLHNGNYVYESSKQDKPTVEVPSMFYLGLPFFDGAGDGFIFPIKLRYRIKEGKLNFGLLFHNFDKIQKTAWEGVQAAITVGLPPDVPFLNIP